MATSINNTIECNQPHANLDSYYGPYESVNEALQALNSTTINGVDYTKRHIGLTVGIMVSEPGGNGIIEYWFKNGTSDNDLVLKTSGSSLPGGVKIVTFNENGATGGAQNSILTDKYSQVKLPDCTLTKTNDTFKKWQYNDVQYKAGDIVTIGSFTEVLAIWDSSPAPTQKYSVSWNINPGNGISSITGEANGNTINTGDLVEVGKTVVLTANIENGYTFKRWTNAPSGSSTSSNPYRLTFILNDPVSGISAEADVIPQGCLLTFEKGEGIRALSGLVNGEEAVSGNDYPVNSYVVLTADPEDGYSVIKPWEGAPDYAEYAYENEVVSFELKSDVTITAKAENTPVETGFYYYGCTSTENGAKGGGEENVNDGGEDVDPGGETGTKWFTNPEEDLIPVKGINSGQIDNSEHKYNILYTITNNNVAPTCNVDGIEPIYFIPLNKCDDDTIKVHFNEIGWITGGNKTAGSLVTYGNYMFIYIDKEKVLDNQTFIISIEK